VTRQRYACCDRRRLTLIAGHATLNAIDSIEVSDLVPPELDPEELAAFNALPPGARDRLLWQRKLSLHFVNALSVQQVAGLTAETIRLTGGERIRDIRVAVLSVADDVADLRASAAGDYSRYTLSLVRPGDDRWPPDGFDPILSAIEFSFKVDCPSDFDCRREEACSAAPVPAPEIDYLAKDYGSFRRLILDRISQVAPDWRERNAADLGIALIELLAYVGDHLSYEQDAVATEAYLNTARRRVSVRRHAALVDYVMHDGCNARAWLHLTVNDNPVVLDPDDIQFFTTVDGLDPRVLPDSPEVHRALDAGVDWFGPVVPSLDPTTPGPPITLFADHNELPIYAWGDDRCCLPRGATRATLLGHHANLVPGMALLFEEVKGPRTGAPADADPRHRHVLRLTRVEHTDVAGPLMDPLHGALTTEIEWGPEDRLPFPLCISSRSDEDDETVTGVSVARGNILLVDHGRRVTQDLGTVPAARRRRALASEDSHCGPGAEKLVPPRFRPGLTEAALTQTGTVLQSIENQGAIDVVRVRFDAGAPAVAAFAFEMRDVRASISLESEREGSTTTWSAARDLLTSSGSTPAFVAEMEHDGTTRLRFGDDEHGLRPRVGERFIARYRVGNGTSGNVGADSIVHTVALDARVVAVRNPLPARGGRNPETVEEVRRRAPYAFRTQERAVTPEDYEASAVRHAAVQRAAATVRWTGSWHTVFLTIDPEGESQFDSSLETALARHLERYRMAGHDIELDAPRYVPLEIELSVCVEPTHFRSEVKERLLAVLSSRTRPDGVRGVFHPSNFTFGQPVYLSPILAAARGVAGVASASAVRFHRQGIDESGHLADGQLSLGRLEIARLDNDANFPERGVLRIRVSGGK
jgi:hypothetical protein